MNNQVIQNGGVKEKGTGLFGWGESNAYWGQEFEQFTRALGNVDSTKQTELQSNPTRNPKNMAYMNTKGFTIVLEDGKKLKEIQKFLKSGIYGERISELKLYSIVEELASGNKFTQPYPIDIKVSESTYTINSTQEEKKKELIDRVQKVYDLFKDVMSTIPSGEGAGRRLDELIAKVDDYLYGNSHDIKLLSLSHGVKQTQYRPDSSQPWNDYKTGEFKIWSSNEGMHFSVGDVLYWLISYLQFYKSFPLKGKGKKLDGSEMPYTWKQLNAMSTGSNEVTIEEEIKQGKNLKKARIRVWMNYMKYKRAVIMRNRRDYIKKSLVRDGFVGAWRSGLTQVEKETLKNITKTLEILPLWYFNSTYEQNPGEFADEVLEIYLNKYSTVIRQRNENKAQVDSIMTELSGKEGESTPAQVNGESHIDSDSDSDSDDDTIVPAGSKLENTQPGSTIELETSGISKSEDQDKKNEILKKLNFVEVPVPDDGDCLFEAMALFLKKEKTNKQLREQIIDEISNNWDKYKDFIIYREGCDKNEQVGDGPLTNWCKTPENYKKMMMVSRDEAGNLPNWYVPKGRFGGLEEMKVFGELYNTPVKLYVIDETDKKLSTQFSSDPIEGRPVANFLFDPIKGHYSLLKSIPTSETKTWTPADIVVADTSKKLFFDKYLEWLKQSHPRQ